VIASNAVFDKIYILSPRGVLESLLELGAGRSMCKAYSLCRNMPSLEPSYLPFEKPVSMPYAAIKSRIPMRRAAGAAAGGGAPAEVVVPDAVVPVVDFGVVLVDEFAGSEFADTGFLRAITGRPPG
jgi:hypothetical protein